MSSLKTNSPFIVKLAMTLISLMALVYIAVLTKKVTAPLFFSLLCALVLLPIATIFEKKLKLPRAGAAILSLLILSTFLLFIFYLIGSQVASLAHDWPTFQQQFHGSLNDAQHWVTAHFHIDVHQQKEYIDSTTYKVFSSGVSVPSSTLLSFSSVLLFIGMTTLFTFFFLLYRKLVLRFLIAVFRKESADLIYDIVASIQSMIRQYLLGLLMEMSVVVMLCMVSFLAFGVRYATLFALITAFFNIVPYVGIFTALVLSTFITFSIGAGTGKVIIVVVTIFVVHLIDGNILLPFLVASKVRINGMITVLAVIGGEMIWGIPGMFLAIPLVAVTKIIFDRIDTLKPWGILLGHEKNEQHQ